ncbi:MAG: hypothetical protein CMH69_00435 [Nitratireductor sp.]|nr:hypothetical protein [Nitratireductor sp.]
MQEMTMGVVTVNHYRASKLPKELRKDIPHDALVKVTVEEEVKREAPPRTPEELLAQIERVRARQTRRVSSEDAARRIRALRDEWDD